MWRPAWIAVLALSGSSCAERVGDARELEVANVLARADEPLIRVRPALVRGKYELMAASAISFERGTLALYRHDFREVTSEETRTAFGSGELVPSLGDAHPENFGTLRATDGTFALEPNDFDAADRAPYQWDVRRLVCGLAVAATVANDDDDDARAATASARRAIARAAALAYASGAAARVVDGADPILADLFSRSRRDLASRRELATLTTVVDAKRSLIRGVVDPADPANILAELPRVARAALPGTLARYRETLLAPPPAEFFTILDAARELGTGVASFPRIRALVLVRGPTDDPSDDVILEVKEVSESGIAGLYPPGVYANDVAARIRTTSRTAWAQPDAAPLWGTSDWLGLPVQVREETEAHKTVRVSRMVGNRGTPAALTALASVLGAVVARIHASPTLTAKLAPVAEAFADEQADYADACASRLLADHGRFVRVLGRLGPRLGIPFDPADAPRADLAALIGLPPGTP